MSVVTGIGIALLLLITVPKILSFYNVSLSAYGVFIIILSFILPHDFLVTVTNSTNILSNINTNTSQNSPNAMSNGSMMGQTDSMMGQTGSMMGANNNNNNINSVDSHVFHTSSSYNPISLNSFNNDENRIGSGKMYKMSKQANQHSTY